MCEKLWTWSILFLVIGIDLLSHSCEMKYSSSSLSPFSPSPTKSFYRNFFFILNHAWRPRPGRRNNECVAERTEHSSRVLLNKVVRKCCLSLHMGWGAHEKEANTNLKTKKKRSRERWKKKLSSFIRDHYLLYSFSHVSTLRLFAILSPPPLESIPKLKSTCLGLKLFHFDFILRC